MICCLSHWMMVEIGPISVRERAGEIVVVASNSGTTLMLALGWMSIGMFVSLAVTLFATIFATTLRTGFACDNAVRRTLERKESICDRIVEVRKFAAELPSGFCLS